MSDIFTSGDNQADTNGQSEGTETTSVLGELVGEGKKFKDVDALARGKLESDRYIERLEKALEEASMDLNESKRVEDLLAQLKDRNKTPDATAGKDPEPEQKPGSTRQSDNTSQSVGEDDIERLVEKTLTEREKARTAKQNIDEATDLVSRQLGDKASEFVSNKAKELGLPVERLRDIAAESPTAFVNLLGLDSKPQKGSLQNTVRSEGMSQMNQPDERTNSWYVNLRKTDRAKYYHPSTQAQMYKDADRLGDKFWQ